MLSVLDPWVIREQRREQGERLQYPSDGWIVSRWFWRAWFRILMRFWMHAANYHA